MKGVVKKEIKLSKFFSLNVRLFCQSKEKSNLPAEINENNKNLDKLNNFMPLEKIDEELKNDILKYKVFQDSLPKTVEDIKKEVPEIAKHLEFREWINSIIDQDKQDETLKLQGLVVLKQRKDIFYKYGIDTHNYRKFHDRDYEVDIKHELTKDLYENQRVLDNIVEENKEQINKLLGFYNNSIKHTQYNKYAYLIYDNNYLLNKNLKKIKTEMIKNILGVSFASTCLAFINPYLLFLLLPEYYALLKMFFLLNNLVDQIVLTNTKSSVLFRTFNFLGFRTEFAKANIDILKIYYDKKIKNDFLKLNDKGIFFITRLLRRQFKKENKQLDNFSDFHRVKSSGRTFYIPADLSTQSGNTNEELISAIMNNNLKFVMEYDYSDYENSLDQLNEIMENYKKELAKKSHEIYVTEEDRLKQEYSKYFPNRDFDDLKFEGTLKRTDGHDGLFINNGYR